MSDAEHWKHVYEAKAPTTVSWYQPLPTLSLELIAACALPRTAPIVDVGAGASTLVDELLQLGYRDVTLLDVAEPALEVARRRLPHDDPRVSTVVADVTSWEPPRTFALWHDRAVFHFLTEEAQRDAYRRTLRAALVPGSRAILATFALDGPERCSGLPVRRYDAVTLAAELRSVLRPIESRHEVHRTPTGSPQSFLYTLFERV